MKKNLLTGLAAITIGIISALPFAGADPIGVLFLKRVDTNPDNTEIAPGTNSAMLFEITNGYSGAATIANVLLDHIKNEGTSNESIDFTGSGFSFAGSRGSTTSQSPTESTEFSFATTGLTIAPDETVQVSLDVTLDEGEENISQVLLKQMGLVSGSGVYLSTGSGTEAVLLGSGSGTTLDGALFNVVPEDTEEQEKKEEVDFLTEKTLNEDLLLNVDPLTEQFYFAAQTKIETPAADAIEGVTDGLSIIIPAGTTFTGSGTVAWTGEMEAPKVLGMPTIHDLPSMLVPVKRISVGSPSTGISFSKPVTISIPLSGGGERYIYSSENGTNWKYEKRCKITDNPYGAGGICIFGINHFTEFLVADIDSGTEDEDTYEGHTSGGGQNTMRHGNYDPNYQGPSLEGALPPEVKMTILTRLAKKIETIFLVN